MIRFLLIVSAFFLCLTSFAQHADKAAAKPRYRYIYSITREQAWKISEKKYKDVFTDAFLKQAIDSLGALQAISSVYNKGGYISVYSKGKNIAIDFLKSHSLHVDVVTTPFEQGIIVKDVVGNTLEDVEFYTKEGVVRFPYNGYFYIIPKKLYGKSIIVEHNAEFVLISVPPKCTKNIQPKRKYSDKDKKSFVLVDKPKYHVGDTVFIKGYLPVSLFNKRAEFFIYYKNNTHKVVAVKKENVLRDVNGSYLYSFVIPDSLSIDKEYSITLSQKSNYAYSSFFIQDYYLNDFSLQADLDFGKQYQDSIQIDVQYTNPQGDAVEHGWIYVRLEPLTAYVSQRDEVYMPALFVQDSIKITGNLNYTYRGKVPTLPNGKYGLQLTVRAQSNGQVAEIKKEIDYNVSPVVVMHAISGSVFTFNAYHHGNRIDQGYALYGNKEPYDTVLITFPYNVDTEKLALPRSFCFYNVGSFPYVSKSTEVLLTETGQIQPTAISYSIKNNKVELHVENPFHLKIRVIDAHEKKMCESKDSLIVLELPLQKKQLLFCEYLFKGLYVQKYLVISPDYNAFLIDAEVPDMISPGQSYTGNVFVSHLKKGAAKNVNLTAFAVDNRFVHKKIPHPVDAFKYEYKEISSIVEQNASVALLKDSSIQKYVYTDYNDFLYHDSINYFLIPEYDTSLTEAFIYIEKRNQYSKPIYIFEDGLPVYWQESDGVSAKSFYTTAGYHAYEIRLCNKTIYLDSIYVYASYKNNILIHIDRIAKNQIKTVSQPHYFTHKETDRLYALLYILRGNKYVERIVSTQSNSYYFSHENNVYVLNGNAVFHNLSKSSSVFINKADTLPGRNYYEYLSKKHFKNSKQQESYISIAELKKIEDTKIVNVSIPYKTSARQTKLENNPDSINYAILYVHQDLTGHAFVQLVDGEKHINKGVVVRYDVIKFKLDYGNYQLQIRDSLGRFVSEETIHIDKPGHYIKSIYSATRFINIKKDSLDKMYGNDFLEPNRTKPRKRTALLNYIEIIGGVNTSGLNSNDLQPRYQLGAMIGHQYMSSHFRIELRGLYGKSALTGTSYEYGKLGVLGWASLYKLEKLFRRRPTINAYIGTGLYGQSVFVNKGQTFGYVVPIGAALQYKISYRFDLGLEAIWNTTVSGKDYTNGSGIFEMNFKLHINVNHHVRKARYTSHSYLLSKGGTYSASKNSKATQNTITATTTTTTTNSVTLSEVSIQDAKSSKPSIEYIRSDFYDRAYWVPSFKTDRSGKATFTARYPDALTQWDNYILAYKGRRSNTWHSQTTTYLKDYVQLYVPRFAIKGDSLSASYQVHSDLQTSVVNKVDGDFINESFNTDSIFSFYASESLDTLTCSTSLFTNSKLIDGEQHIIPLFNAGNEVYSGTYTYFKGDTIMYIHKPDSVLEAEIYLSGSIRDLVRVQYKHLMEYPYSCNEQTASKLIASVYEKELGEYYKGKHMQDFYLKLKKNCNADNIYGWWKENPSSLSMTAYVYYALTIYYKKESLIPDKFYNDLSKALVAYAAEENVSHFVYWLMKESGLSMKGIYISQRTQLNLQEEILNLRIQQLQGKTVARKEVEQYLESTMLENTSLKSSSGSLSNWYGDDLLFLIILHKIVKADYPDIAENIRKGLIERGCLSINTPTYIKALFIEECMYAEDGKKAVSTVTYDKTNSNTLPFSKVISDTSTHILSVKDASGMYVVNTTKQIETKEITYSDLGIHFQFKQDGILVDALSSGHMAEQIVTVTVKKTSFFVMVEIPIAAGCMVEELSSSNQGLIRNREVYRDKIVLYFDQLPTGTYTFIVRQKVLFKGNYQLNPCSIHLMYFPMMQTQTALRRIVIE